MTDTTADFETATDTLKGAYEGEGMPLFWLALKTGLLTLITLGIYRFWAKARIRRYLWSATAPGGNPFEYTGTGLEKFLGFLFAVVILAVYLGLFQILLFFVGLSVFSGGDSEEDIIRQIAATYLTAFATLPLLYYAQYRGRRYLLSRTRWRGVRFGAEKGAWGYVWRALGYTLLSIMSLGILIPLQTFKLEKYMYDRTWYGDARFHQEGRWTMLYAAAKHIFIAMGLLLLGGVLGVVGADMPPGPMGFSPIAGAGIFLGILGYVWLIVGTVAYSVNSFRLLANNKVLGDNIRFAATPKTGVVIGTYLLGSMAVGLAVTILFIPIAIVGAGVGALLGAMAGTMDEEMMIIGITVLVSLGYIAAIVLAGALATVFITQPILRHYVEEMTVENASALDRVRQREGDDIVDAEGFADALDVGAGF